MHDDSRGARRTAPLPGTGSGADGCPHQDPMRASQLPQLPQLRGTFADEQAPR
ncbi:hypothetical protein AB0M61_47655 [Streptomyces sp. NPDC051642]|uniref:hypothetical protein n=1 Tax=Streptomyces sp. NPDC051642 TaxID=3154646 RepID=UPI003440B95A